MWEEEGDVLIILRDKIRLAIRDMDSIVDLQKLVAACWNTLDADKEFVRECISEIHWRQKEDE